MSETLSTSTYAEIKKLYGQRHLRLRIIMYMAYRNLAVHKLRTILTAGGVLIGIGAITFLLSLGLGLQDLVSRQVLGSKSVTAIDVTPPGSNIVQLNSNSIAKIEHIDGVKEIAKSYTLASKASFGSSNTDTVVYGADNAYLALSSLHLVTSGGLQLQGDHILANTSLLKLIGLSNNSAAVGKKLDLDILIPLPDGSKKQFAVTGIIQGVVDTGSGSEVFMSPGLLAKAGLPSYSQIKVVASSESQVGSIRKHIEDLGFSTASPIDTLNQINQLFTFFNFILAGFGGIGMLIAVLGMFNTLTISLLERTRETALMISLGARRRDVYQLFVAEAVGLAFLGGVCGILASWLLGVAINILLNHLAHSRGVADTVSIFSLPWWLVIATLGFVLLVALAVVTYPALRAVRVNPVDALRHE